MSTIQIRLLNDGGYGYAASVDFPVVVEATKSSDILYDVHSDELYRVGFDSDWLEQDEEWPFYVCSECEVIS